MWWEVEAPPSFLCHLLERPPNGLGTFVKKQLTTDSLLLLINGKVQLFFLLVNHFYTFGFVLDLNQKNAKAKLKVTPSAHCLVSRHCALRPSGLCHPGPICPEKGQEQV